MVTITPEDFARYHRISQDPFASEFHYAVYPTPVASDDCVFKHGADYLPSVDTQNRQLIDTSKPAIN